MLIEASVLAYLSLRYNKIAANLRSHFRCDEIAPQHDSVVIFIPGLLGVKLYDQVNQELLWGDGKSTLFKRKNYGHINLDSNGAIPYGEIDTFPIIPKLLESLVYYEIKKSLQLGCSLNVDDNLLFLSYDWRKDYRHLADALDQQIKDVLKQKGENTPIILIGQSMSNLAVQYYLNHYQAAPIKRWYAFGPPWKGSFNSLEMMESGYYPAGQHFNGFSSELIASYPSSFQLLPAHAEIVDLKGQLIHSFNIYDADQWRYYNIANSEDWYKGDDLQDKLDDALRFQTEVKVNHQAACNYSRVWFVGDKNLATTRGLWDKRQGKLTVSPKKLAKHYPQVLQQETLAIGDEHIPLEQFTQEPCGALIRDFSIAPLNSSYIAIGQAKDHRALINYSPNIDLLIKDLNYNL